MGYIWQSLIVPDFFFRFDTLRDGLKLFNDWGSDFLGSSNVGVKTDQTISDSAS